jgi:ankyrin repeat protein
VACREGHVDVVQFLLNQHIDLTKQDVYNRTPLHYAVYHHHIDIVNLLLSKNINCNIKDCDDKTPIMYVAPGPRGHQQLFELLLPFSDINAKSQGITLLYKAVQQNYFLGVRYLLKHGADPYVTCITNQCQRKMSHYYYFTPLNLAVINQYDSFEDQVNNYNIITILSRYMNYC